MVIRYLQNLLEMVKLLNLSFDKIIKNPRSKFNFIVQDGDEITY